MDRESLQKKYEVVLTQLSSKAEKVQFLETEVVSCVPLLFCRLLLLLIASESCG